LRLLIFCGAVGKSGQLPLHVWLPDAMEGPTPVSALIHAATMVAAGVFLIARVYPLMTPEALQVVTWVGALTAVFAASIAVAQKRHQTHPGLFDRVATRLHDDGTGRGRRRGGHVSSHDARLFQGVALSGRGSVIHGCHEEQDIRNMGGLRKRMPVTFATYAVGMMALCGVPLFFSGFWSKDAILDAAHHWRVSQVPFYLGLFGAFLTAFYMTRQVCACFSANPRPGRRSTRTKVPRHDRSADDSGGFGGGGRVFRNARLALVPILSGRRLGGIRFVKTVRINGRSCFLSTGLVAAAIVWSGWIYGRASARPLREADPLETAQPALFACCGENFLWTSFTTPPLSA
jgi:NADH:ubiquinone oxidoreductase subunit 5 (subunit L)/multisubunit Na+/H+ antiporter MnhA subunit